MFEHRPFGSFLKLSVRGASHASAIGFKLENFPARFAIDFERLGRLMERRAPGRDEFSTQRREDDKVEFIGGVRNGVTTGEMIVGRIANGDVRSRDYGIGRTIPRPGHADFGQWVEYGRIVPGGGANSGRLTAAMCAAGGLCLQWLSRQGVSVAARVAAVGGRSDDAEGTISAARSDGDSVGGVIECEVKGVRPGLGGAMFAGIESELSAALFAIPGVKGVSFGNGFESAALRGSENDDPFVIENAIVRTRGNNHGGILGGRTSGMPIRFTLALKPTPTIFKPLESVDLVANTAAVSEMKGRHDPCIVRRAVPVVEALTAFVLADMMLAVRAAASRICLSLTGPTLEDNLAQLGSERLFTDMVELRADLLSEIDVDRVAAFLRSLAMPAVVTFRRKNDGGAFAGDEQLRVDFFRRLLATGQLDDGEFYFDFENDFRDAELERETRRRGIGIVRSMHFFSPPKESIASLCRKMVEGSGEIAKVAFMPESAVAVGRLFREAEELAELPHVICAMGPLGQATRALAVRIGSLWTYASCGGLEGLGHVSPSELVRTFRFRTQTSTYALYGVTGWPLVKTMSPELHNEAFLAEDRDAVMAAFPAATAADAVSLMRDAGVMGMAVTIPHKQSVMPLLDEISPEAIEIGAVNTIAVKDGRLIGYNTDADGFAEALCAFLGRDRLDGFKAAVLGNGGAAKAVTYALERLGAETETFHRRTPSAGFDLLVNATPVDPIPDYEFSGSEALYDLVYLPEVTPLMARAKAAGCRVENGLSMLKAQARRQRQIWGEC